MIDNNIFKKVSEIYTYCRYLMAEFPLKAELEYNILVNRELSSLNKNEDFIVKLVINGVPDNDFIVHNKGIAKSVSALSDKDLNLEIKYIEIDNKRNLLFENFVDKCDKFKTENSDYYNAFKIEDLKQQISSYYQDIIYEISDIILLGAIENIPQPKKFTMNEVKTWSNKCITKLLFEYHKFVLPGNLVNKLMAILFFINYSTNKTLETLFSKINLNNKFNLPSLNISDYISNDIELDEFLNSLNRIYEAANKLREQAQDQSTYQMFQKVLYEALLFYTCIIESYDSVSKKLPNNIKLDSLKQTIYMCEEMQVLIKVSIKPFKRNGIPDFNHASNYFRWLLSDFKQDGQFYGQASKHQIHDFYQRLYFPKRMKSIALIICDLLKHGYKNENRTNELKECIERIEREFKEYILVGETDYLIALYEFIIELSKSINNKQEKEKFQKKLNIENIYTLYDNAMNKNA